MVNSIYTNRFHLFERKSLSWNCQTYIDLPYMGSIIEFLWKSPLKVLHTINCHTWQCTTVELLMSYSSDSCAKLISPFTSGLYGSLYDHVIHIALVLPSACTNPTSSAYLQFVKLTPISAHFTYHNWVWRFILTIQLLFPIRGEPGESQILVWIILYG